MPVRGESKILDHGIPTRINLSGARARDYIGFARKKMEEYFALLSFYHPDRIGRRDLLLDDGTTILLRTYGQMNIIDIVSPEGLPPLAQPRPPRVVKTVDYKVAGPWPCPVPDIYSSPEILAGALVNINHLTDTKGIWAQEKGKPIELTMGFWNGDGNYLIEMEVPEEEAPAKLMGIKIEELEEWGVEDESEYLVWIDDPEYPYEFAGVDYWQGWLTYVENVWQPDPYWLYEPASDCPSYPPAEGGPCIATPENP